MEISQFYSNIFHFGMNAESFKGKIIGNYKIKGTIGQGAFSIVCLAEEIELKSKDPNSKDKKKKESIFAKIKKKFTKGSKRYAACKIIPRTKIKEKKLSKRLDQEIRIYQQMHHPNVVQLIDVQKDSTFYYIFLEFCPCGELYQILNKKGPLTETDAAIFFKQLLIGLQYIHSLNVGHRDLKLENILIDQFGRVKISDFGLSKLLRNEDNGLTGTPCGSPCYVSPECISGHPYDPRKSDIWSCGVILYELTTGELPWTKRTQAKLFQQIRNGEYSIPSKISDSCSNLIIRLMTVDTTKRITIEEALNHPFLKDTPVLVPTIDRKFVSLRKIDRFLGKDDEFEYNEIINKLVQRNPEINSQQDINFIKIRKSIESEDEKKKEKEILINMTNENPNIVKKDYEIKTDASSNTNEKKKKDNLKKRLFKKIKVKKQKKNSKQNDDALKKSESPQVFNNNLNYATKYTYGTSLQPLKSEQMPLKNAY